MAICSACRSGTLTSSGGHKSLLDQLAVSTLSGFGADGMGAAFGAAGALLRYAQSTQGRGLQHVKSLAVESENEFIGLDAATRRNLELTETIRGARLADAVLAARRLPHRDGLAPAAPLDPPCAARPARRARAATTPSPP